MMILASILEHVYIITFSDCRNPSGELLITNRSSALTSSNLVIDYLTLRQAVMCSKIPWQVIHK